jgi:hypothetical protein
LSIEQLNHVDEREYDLFRTSNGRWFHYTALKVKAPPHSFKNTAAVRPGGRLEAPQIQCGSGDSSRSTFNLLVPNLGKNTAKADIPQVNGIEFSSNLLFFAVAAWFRVIFRVGDTGI